MGLRTSVHWNPLGVQTGHGGRPTVPLLASECYIAGVSRSTRKLDELATLLEKTGGDALRLDTVRRTQKFKRSWLELAERLCAIRKQRSYERWGFEDFYAYCHDELTLKKVTVDKLTTSYSTLQKHAPQVLEWDGVAKVIPGYDAINYFSRAVAAESANDTTSRRNAPTELVRELSQAVFDEGVPVGELRRRFDPVLHPKPKAKQSLELLDRADASARKLLELLPDIHGLSEKRIRQVEDLIGSLREELSQLAEPLRTKLEQARKHAKPPKLAPVLRG